MNFANTPSPKNTRKPVSRSTHSVFEVLEDRRMFSVTVSAGVLQVTTGSGNDTIYIDEVADDISAPTNFHCEVNGVDTVVSSDLVSEIHVDSGAGNDNVTVGFCGGYQNVVAHLGDGNDTFREADANASCQVYGGNGNDDIQGTDYRDYLDGGLGNDKLDGLGDDDHIVPGGGFDSILGGEGDDIGANFNDEELKATGGAIQAEDFDEGNEGYGYHDTTPALNLFSSTYRSDTGVDIFDGFGSTGHAVGSFVPTEWMQYTITVPTTGIYNFNASYATPIAGTALKISCDGAAITGNVTLPTTVGWNTFTNKAVNGLSLTGGTHVFRIASVGSNAFNFDSFSFTPAPTTGNISGNVFNDLNQNKIKDGAEHGIAGVKVYLDANNNGHFDTGETFVGTDASGNYAFTGVHPGTVHVREVLPTGFRNVVGAANHYDVAVTAGGNATGKNFALSAHPLVSGKVFRDTNGNGAQNTGENGLSGWIVYADLNHDGIFEAGENSRVTDSSGNFTFNSLNAGSYVFRVLGPTGYHQTTPAAGGGLHVTVTNGQVVNAGAFGEQPIV